MRAHSTSNPLIPLDRAPSIRQSAGVLEVLMILGTIVAFLSFPIATVLGLIGVWIFGFWGALVGVVVGLFVQAEMN